MRKANIIDGKKGNPPAEYFTDKVIMQDLSKDTNSPDHKVFHVTFTKGARTKLHHHTGSQILVVTRGNGSLMTFKKIGPSNKFKVKKTGKTDIKQGDIVSIPANTLHTHGAITSRAFSHIAINTFSKNKEPKTTWFDLDTKDNTYHKI